MTHRPTTPADHIAHAKETLTGGANPTYAIAHALIAIAELQLSGLAIAAGDQLCAFLGIAPLGQPNPEPAA